MVKFVYGNFLVLRATGLALVSRAELSFLNHVFKDAEGPLALLTCQTHQGFSGR